MESLYGGIAGPGGDGVPSAMGSYDTGEQAGSGHRVWAGGYVAEQTGRQEPVS